MPPDQQAQAKTLNYAPLPAALAKLNEETLKSVRALMGNDFWAYGVEPNRATLELFLRHHHSQGLSPRLMKVEEMFHPAVYETFKL